jgi:hypothetical protein
MLTAKSLSYAYGIITPSGEEGCAGGNNRTGDAGALS